MTFGELLERQKAEMLAYMKQTESESDRLYYLRRYMKYVRVLEKLTDEQKNEEIEVNDGFNRRKRKRNKM